VLLAVVAGCLAPATNPTTTDGTTTTTERTTTTTTAPTGNRSLATDTSGETAVIDGGIVLEGDPGNEERHFLAVVGTRDDADCLNYAAVGDETALRAFVEAVDFSTEALVVFEEYPDSSVPDYRVEDVSPDGDVVRIRVNDSSTYGTDDVTVEHLFVRVPRTDAGEVPEVVVVTEDGREFATGDGDEWSCPP